MDYTNKVPNEVILVTLEAKRDAMIIELEALNIIRNCTFIG